MQTADRSDLSRPVSIAVRRIACESNEKALDWLGKLRREKRTRVNAPLGVTPHELVSALRFCRRTALRHASFPCRSAIDSRA